MKANDTIAKQRPMKIEKERIDYAPKNISEKKRQETEGKYGKVCGRGKGRPMQGERGAGKTYKG